LRHFFTNGICIPKEGDMPRKIECVFVDHPDEEGRSKKIIEILSHAIFKTLKEKGLLRKSPTREKRLEDTLKEAREIRLRLKEDAETDCVDSA